MERMLHDEAQRYQFIMTFDRVEIKSVCDKLIWCLGRTAEARNALVS